MAVKQLRNQNFEKNDGSVDKLKDIRKNIWM